MYRFSFVSSLFSSLLTICLVLSGGLLPAEDFDRSTVFLRSQPLLAQSESTSSAFSHNASQSPIASVAQAPVAQAYNRLGNAPSAHGTVHPALLRFADEAPDESVRVIVQKSTASPLVDDAAELAIVATGGEVIRPLDIINGFVAQLPAGRIPSLADAAGIRWVSLDAPVQGTSHRFQSRPTAPYFDMFNTNDYGGNDGTSSWSEDWSELGEVDGAALGNVVVTRFLGGEHQGLRIQDRQRGIQRFFDLSNSDGAALSFNYRRKGFTSEAEFVRVQISTDDGLTWTEIARIQGPGDDATLVTSSYDISQYSSPTVGIRFVSSTTMTEDNKVYIDNVKVDVAGTGTVAPPPAPSSAFALYLPQIAGGGNGIIQPKVEALDEPITVTSRRMEVDSRPQALDVFNARSFNGSDGTEPWKTGWYEQGESNGPKSGILQIRGSRRCASGYCMRIGARSSSDRSVEEIAIVREVDLSNTSEAELSFSYRRRAVPRYAAAPTVNVEVSTDAGRNWSILKTYHLERTDSQLSQEVVALSDYASSNTQIRFVLSGDLYAWESSYFFLDNVKVAFNRTETSPPPDDNQSVVDPDLPYIETSVKDSFHAIGYSNNDGTADWVGSWLEVNDDNSPYRGDIGISYNELLLRNNNRRIQRSLNLENSQSSTLSFSYRRSGFDSNSDYVVFEMSTDSGRTWNEVHRIAGSGSDWQNQRVSVDISRYAAATTTLRISTSPSLGQWDQFYVDDIRIDYHCADCIETSLIASKHVRSLGAAKLWNGKNKLQGQGITVAVIDSGISQHPDLLDKKGRSRILEHVNFVPGNIISDDYYGHGTHVAGVIGGNGKRSKGTFTGMAPQVNLVDVRVVDDFGKGYTSTVLDGVKWVLDNKDKHKIRVVNMSLNSSVAESYHVSPINAALEILWFNEIVVLVSAGNNGDNGELLPPANDPFLLTIGGSDTKGTDALEDDEVASFSARGYAENGTFKPELLVPGKAIVGALASDDSNIIQKHKEHIVPGANGNNYVRMSGTSVASAVATGAVALLLQDEPHLTPDQVKYRLMATAKQKGNNNFMRIVHAVNGDTNESANLHTEVSRLLRTGINGIAEDDAIWPEVHWTSVHWTSVHWTSVHFTSVHWTSVNWDLENLDSFDEPEDRLLSD